MSDWEGKSYLEKKFFQNGKDFPLFKSFMFLLNDRTDLNGHHHPAFMAEDVGLIYTITVGSYVPLNRWLTYCQDPSKDREIKKEFQEKVRANFYKSIHFLDPDLTPNPERKLEEYRHKRLEISISNLERAKEWTIEHAVKNLLLPPYNYTDIGEAVVEGARQFMSSGDQRLEREYDFTKKFLYRRMK